MLDGIPIGFIYRRLNLLNFNGNSFIGSAATVFEKTIVRTCLSRKLKTLFTPATKSHQYPTNKVFLS
jgi:hypothetical protein